MEYRILPHGGKRISVLGMGSSVIGALPPLSPLSRGAGHRAHQQVL